MLTEIMALPYFPDSMFSEEGHDIDRTEIILPPSPIRRTVYKCDSIFHVSSILDMYVDHDKYGVVYINGENTEFYYYDEGKGLNRIGRYGVKLPRNHDMGGQSQNRVERLRQEKIWEYLKGVNERSVNYYIDTETGLMSVKGVIIAGPGQKPSQLIKGPLDKRLSIIKTIKCEKLDSSQIQEAVIGSLDNEVSREWDKFKLLLETNPDKLSFGKEETLGYMKDGYLETVFSNTSIEECECKNVVVGSVCDIYGGVCGIKWF